jgi:hypothetical protein
MRPAASRVPSELRLRQVLNPQVNRTKAFYVHFAQYYESTTTRYVFRELTGPPASIDKQHNGVSRRNPSG